MFSSKLECDFFCSNIDSYQDKDLMKLRECWLDILEQRKQYLDDEMKRLANKGVVLTDSYVNPVT